MKFLQPTKKQFMLFFAFLLLLPVVPSPLSAPDVAMAQSNEDLVREEELIYVSDRERIIVLDTHQVGDNPLVLWASPDEDWRAIDAGDFNNDGDMEIVAVGGSEEDGKLAIFDPVDRSGDPGLRKINGIPWRELYRIDIPGRPTLVKAGNFDPNLPGDEIIYGFEKENDDVFRIIVIKSAKSNPDGTQWTEHIKPKDDGNTWSYITSVDLGDGGPDEVALLDEDGGEVSIFRLVGGWSRFFSDSASDRPYRAVTFGNYYDSQYKEVLISRNDSSPAKTLYYMEYFPGDEEELQERRYESLSPYQRFLFTANVNGRDGSDDDELFMLRREADPRLASRNAGGDSMPPLEAALDDDDGYRTGVGGDMDGDGNDEVVILRDDKVRIYRNEINRWSIQEIDVQAEDKVIRAADLDGAGAVVGPRFAFSVETIEQSLEPDTAVENRQFELINDNSDDTVSFTYQVTGNPSWVSVVSEQPQQASAADPARIFVSFNSAGLTFGAYRADLVFTSSSATNSPFTVPIVMTVREAQVTPNPSALWFMYQPCPDTLAPMSMDIAVGGTAGVRYNAAIVERPLLQSAQQMLDGPITAASIGEHAMLFADASGKQATIELPPMPEISASGVTTTTWPSAASWVSASSVTGEVPDTLTVVANPGQRPEQARQAVLVLVGDQRAGEAPTNVKIVPLNLSCFDARSYLPSVFQ